MKLKIACVDGHPMQPGQKKCSECGKDPKPIEAKDLVPAIEELAEKVEELSAKLTTAPQKTEGPSVARKAWDWFKSH